MDYQETLSWLYNQLPFYQKSGQDAYKKDISNMVDFFNKNGADYLFFDTIHVGGTNGKGSVSHMLSSVLQESSLKVGLFTSPHLIDFKERIKINGKSIDESSIINFVDHYKHDFNSIKMSFFEMSVALAFKYFKNNNVDIAIIEVGLGGRLDATNVLFPKLSIITNISRDHTNLLGFSLDLISKEKGGIIKENTPVLVGEKSKATIGLEDIANNLKSELLYAKDHSYDCDLKGAYQFKNINTCVTAVNILNNSGFRISNTNITKGLKNVVLNTGLLGRWQIISKKPLVICDIAHNAAALKTVFKQLEMYPQKKKIILGFSKDKDLDEMISCLNKHYEYHICGSHNSRIINPDLLLSIFNKRGLSAKKHNYAIDAYNYLLKKHTVGNLIIFTGSSFIVSDILKYLDNV